MKKISQLSLFFNALIVAFALVSCQKTVVQAPAEEEASTFTVSSDDQFDANEIVGDFEKQPWDQQWNYVVGKDITKQFFIGNRSQIPVRQGNYAARFIVRPGDQETTGSTGERCEVGHFNDSQHGYTQEKPGDDFYYGWSTYIPSDWKTPTGWCTIAQWHARAATLSPIAVYIGTDNSIGLNVYSGLVTQPASWYKNYAYIANFPLVKNFLRNQWHDFVVHIKFTPNNSGLIQVWHKMQSSKTWVMVMNKANIPTMQLYKPADWPALDIDNHPRAPDNKIPWGAYITTQEWCRIGLYRGPNNFTNTIYHDAWARARWWSAIANNFP